MTDLMRTKAEYFPRPTLPLPPGKSLKIALALATALALTYLGADLPAPGARGGGRRGREA